MLHQFFGFLIRNLHCICTQVSNSVAMCSDGLDNQNLMLGFGFWKWTWNENVKWWRKVFLIFWKKNLIREKPSILINSPFSFFTAISMTLKISTKIDMEVTIEMFFSSFSSNYDTNWLIDVYIITCIAPAKNVQACLFKD